MIRLSNYYTYLLALISFGILNNSTQAHSSDISLDDIAKTSFIIGGVGISTWGIIKFFSWLIGPSDEIVTSKALSSHRKAIANYMKLTAILGETTDNYTNAESCLNNIQEKVLYNLALAKYYDADIVTYLRQLRQTNTSLAKQHKILRDRMKQIHMQAENGTEATRMYHKMKAIDKELQTLRPQLTFLYNYLKRHESYFILFQTEDKLMYTYERDLQAIKTYAGDILYAREIIHQSVMLQQRNHNELYPYSWYLKRLENDIYMISRTASTLTYDYTERYNVAYDLINKLEAVRATIVGSPYYIDELRAIEHAKLVNATIQAENRKAQAYEAMKDSYKSDSHDYALEN